MNWDELQNGDELQKDNLMRIMCKAVLQDDPDLTDAKLTDAKQPETSSSGRSGPLLGPCMQPSHLQAKPG
jgi:hypothetical protein